MEAVHRREVILGDGMVARRGSLDPKQTDFTFNDVGTGTISGVCSGKINGGEDITAELDASDISKVVDLKDGAFSMSSVVVEEDNNITATIIEVVEESDEEEEIELEIERAAEKTHTHTPYCPNCNNRITKVILRRKKRSNPSINLLGCFACFTIFRPSGNCLNPFGFFKSKPKLEDVGATSANAETWSISDQFPSLGEEEAKSEHRPSHDATVIDIEAATGSREPINIHEGGDQIEQPLISGNERSKSLEILKCIVYGGLIESITSLSVVSSVAASDVTTLSVVAIGLATLLSGLINFGSNLLELRKETSSYEEALGRKGHFAFHSTFAAFSYLVFGLIAPVTYGFAFRESDDKDYKIIAVAAASIGCIFLLSIAKAYVTDKRNLGGYVKSIVCYVTMAVGASGVSYASGDLFGMLLDNLGWFRSPQDIVSPHSWLSY